MDGSSRWFGHPHISSADDNKMSLRFPSISRQVATNAAPWEKMIGDDLMLHSASGKTFDCCAVGEPGCGVISDRISRRQDDRHVERADSSVASSHCA